MTNPQKQQHPQHQQAQHQQSAPEAVVLEVNTSSTPAPVASEAIQVPARPNGAVPTGPQQYAHPQVVPADQFRVIAGQGKQMVIDTGTHPGMTEFYAKMAEANGFHAQAAAIRGRQLDTSTSASFGRLMDKRIEVKDVVYVVLGATLAVLFWEGLAFKFDLPRMGWFDPANPTDMVKLKK